MKMSVREARAEFAHALAAAERGEEVVITRNGHPVATLGPVVEEHHKLDKALLDAARRKHGLDQATVSFDDRFDDPDYSREVLGLNR